MIRKILFGVFCIYLACWLSVAYIIENKLQNFATQNDGLTYTDINISGFPNKWVFKLINPTIKSDDETVKINLHSVILNVSLTFTKFVLEVNKKILVTTEDEDGERIYHAQFTSNPRLIFKRKNRFFSKDSFLGFVSFDVADNIVSITNEDQDLFNVENKAFSFTRNSDQNNDHFLIEYDLNYKGAADFLNFTTLRLDGLQEITFGFDDKEKKIFITSFNSKHFDIIVDEEAELHLAGRVDFKRDELPNGSLTLDLINSNDLIDILWDSNTNLSGVDIKNMLVKASGGQIIDNISLPLVFSSEGLTIGGLSWQELKKGE